MKSNCWSLRCSWSIACRRCSNYIFILNLTPGFNGLGKDTFKVRREAFKFWDLVRLILETLRYIHWKVATTDMWKRTNLKNPTMHLFHIPWYATLQQKCAHFCSQVVFTNSVWQTLHLMNVLPLRWDLLIRFLLKLVSGTGNLQALTHVTVWPVVM